MTLQPKWTMVCPKCHHHESEHQEVSFGAGKCLHRDYAPATLGEDGFWREGRRNPCNCDLTVNDIALNLQKAGDPRFKAVPLP